MSLLLLVAVVRTSALHGEQPSLVFTEAEVKNCTRIRTPSLALWREPVLIKASAHR